MKQLTQLSSIHDDHHGCYLAVKIVSNILKKAQGRKFVKECNLRDELSIIIRMVRIDPGPSVM